LSNTTNSPVEAIDMNFDYFRIVEYGLNAESCGLGKYRGGLGIRRTYLILQDGVDFSLYGDRFEIAPDGLAGGSGGTTCRAELIRDGQAIEVDLKQGKRLMKGDRVVIRTSGGAGFGNPRDRNSDLIERDIDQGYIKAAVAAVTYR